MSEYRPALSDLGFVLEHVVGYPQIAALLGYEHADLETVTGLLEECADFIVETVAPTNRAGDIEGSVRQPDGSVVTPTGFEAA